MRSTRSRLAWMLALAALVVAVPAALGGSANSESVEAGEAEGTNLWFVELSGTPSSFRADAKTAKIEYKERFAFTKLWNGVSIQAAPGQIPALKELAGVAAVYPIYPVQLDPIASNDPAMETALAMTGADVAQSELGYTGAGVKVAVMDSGIDYDHPDLGGDGTQRSNSSVFPTARVTHGYDFVGDAFDGNPASPTYNPNAMPDAYPDDCGGHGTHVAGIVGASPAASTGVTGVAPGVTFGSYRVFGCGGSTTGDIMIAAMERALADGMDILNMSIGSAFMTWPQFPTAAAADELVDRGMVVVASIGNSGANGAYSAGAPGVGRNVIGVASFDNTRVSSKIFRVSPGDNDIPYVNAAGAPAAPSSGSLPMARTGTTTSAADACSPLTPGSLTGYAVLIRRGTCGFYVKAMNAQNAGASAVVLYNNTAGALSPSVAGSPPVTIPVVAVTAASGALLNDKIAVGPTTLTWTPDTTSFVNPTGGLISGFSSFGLTAELDVKPDIGAPGGSIWSTYPLERGGYASNSGTSMSSPHVAGAAALLKEARPDITAPDFRTVLQNSADPKNWWSNPSSGLLDNVHRQGAGMLDIDDSILSSTTVRPGKLALGESESGPSTQTLTVSNASGADVTYDLSHAPALATGGATNSPSYFASFATVAFGAPSVTVPAGSSALVTATITAPATALRQYGGYIVLTPQGGGQTYRVPYAGISGDYQAIQVLTPTANGLPWLARLVGASFFKQSDGAVYTMQGTDVPYFLMHFEHQARALEVTILDAATGQELSGKGRNPNGIKHEYLSRNSTATGFFAFPWDGKLVRNTKGVKTLEDVPDGTYKAVVKVLKALGDPANPTHTETWTSPSFTIDRP